MSLLSKIGKALKKVVKKVVSNPVIGGLVSAAVPVAAPAIKALGVVNKVKKVVDTVKAVKAATPAERKAVAKAAIHKKINLPSMTATMPKPMGFGTFDNPLAWPVGNSPGPAKPGGPVSIKPNTNSQAIYNLGKISANVKNMGSSGGPMIKGMAGGLPAVVPAVGAAVRSYGPGLVRIGKKAAEAAGWIVTGGWIYDQAGNIVGQVKRPQMNYMNGRAAKRAVRRIKGAMKLLRSIERTLPKQKCKTQRYGGKSCR